VVSLRSTTGYNLASLRLARQQRRSAARTPMVQLRPGSTTGLDFLKEMLFEEISLRFGRRNRSLARDRRKAFMIPLPKCAKYDGEIKPGFVLNLRRSM